MNKRVGILIGILLLVVAISLFAFLRRNQPDPVVVDNNKPLATVAKEVVLTDIPYRMEATGTLVAKQKIELFSEVQGVLLSTGTLFKVGSTFRKGQALFKIDASEQLAQVKSNRSSLMNEIAAMMPDLRLDYPNDYRKWEEYLQGFDISSTLSPLPEVTSESEKLFVTGRNIYQTYYTVKNLEAKLSKYTIRAPFTGVIAEALVQPGALIRSGQKLGEFIDTSLFELELSIPATEIQYLNLNEQVELTPLGGGDVFSGNIVRTSPQIDQDTQTITVYIETSNPNIKEGQFIKTTISGATISQVYTIESRWLRTNNEVFVVANNKLQLRPVEPLNHFGNKVVVKGLKNGDLLVTETLANAYPGMTVTLNNSANE